jgi:cation diffusion facilitator CzcD-associated flavoprotein CzcO
VSGVPILLEGSALTVLVVGGGAVAVRKAAAFVAAGAAVRVVAREPSVAMRELARAGGVALTERGHAAVTAALKVAVRGRIDPVAVPRVFRFPNVMPVDAQGKRQVARLNELFARKR